MYFTVKTDAAGVFHGDVEGAEDQCSPLGVKRVADESVDDFHERGLDSVFIFNNGDGMEAREGRPSDAAMGLLMEVAELLTAKSGAAATDSGDLDMSASVGAWHGRYPVDNFFVVAPENLGGIGVRRSGYDEVENLAKKGFVSKFFKIKDLIWDLTAVRVSGCVNFFSADDAEDLPVSRDTPSAMTTLDFQM